MYDSDKSNKDFTVEEECFKEDYKKIFKPKEENCVCINIFCDKFKRVPKCHDDKCCVKINIFCDDC